MLRTVSLLARSFKFSQFKLPYSISDLSNTVGYINSSNQPTLTIFEKLSHFSYSNLYTGLDQFSRELIFTFANDYQLGLPAAVVIISFILRGSFFYPNIKGQIAALKMKQMKPIMDQFTQKMRIAQMSRNMGMMKVAKDQLKKIQKSKGIDNFYNLVNVAQIPFLITWFLSLRYMSALPEVFPSVTQSFLWIPDLSLQDPYWILPVLSACLTSYSITISPGLRSGVAFPMMEPMIKYFKWLPFMSLTITGFFPAILNLYWFSLAINQAILMKTMNSKYIITKYGHIQEPKPQILSAVFVEQKPKAKSQSKDEKKKDQSTIEMKKVEQQQKKNEASDQIDGQKIIVLSKKPKKPKKKPEDK